MGITEPPHPEDPPPKPKAVEEQLHQHAELLALIAPHARPGETPADVLRRLLPPPK